jgi:hypothetical protein
MAIIIKYKTFYKVTQKYNGRNYTRYFKSGNITTDRIHAEEFATLIDNNDGPTTYFFNEKANHNSKLVAIVMNFA